jgi:hypothetical protein
MLLPVYPSLCMHSKGTGNGLIRHFFEEGMSAGCLAPLGGWVACWLCTPSASVSRGQGGESNY